MGRAPSSINQALSLARIHVHKYPGTEIPEKRHASARGGLGGFAAHPTTMVTVADIAHHIAQALSSSTATPRASLESIPAPCLPGMRLCITSDVEESELSYLRRFGRGHTFYFRLRDYASGQKIAAELYSLIPHSTPDASLWVGEELDPGGPLYLFIYIRPQEPEKLPPHRRWQPAPFADGRRRYYKPGTL